MKGMGKMMGGEASGETRGGMTVGERGVGGTERRKD